MRPVFPKAFLGRLTDHLTHEVRGPLFCVRVRSVIDDVGDVVHLAACYAHGGENVEPVLRVKSTDALVDQTGVLTFGGGDGTEEQMGRVGLPVQPVEFFQHRDTTAHGHPGVEVVVGGDVGGEQEFGPLDAAEFGLDEFELRRDRRFVAVLGAVKDPRDVAAGQLGGLLPDHLAWHLAGTGVPVRTGLTGHGEFLDDVPKLRDVAENAFLGERSNDLDNLCKVLFAREGDHVALVAGLGHQPKAHLGDDAVVGLGEDAVDVWTVRRLERLPRRVVGTVFARHGSHAGT